MVEGFEGGLDGHSRRGNRNVGGRRACRGGRISYRLGGEGLAGMALVWSMRAGSAGKLGLGVFAAYGKGF